MSRVIGNINKYSAITPSCGTLVLIGGGNYMNMLRTVVQLAGGKEDIKIYGLQQWNDTLNSVR